MTFSNFTVISDTIGRAHPDLYVTLASAKKINGLTPEFIAMENAKTDLGNTQYTTSNVEHTPTHGVHVNAVQNGGKNPLERS